MTKTEPDVSTTIHGIVDGGLWVSSRSQVTSRNAWQVCFHHDFFENYLQDLKIAQMDAPHDSPQSALRTRV